MTREHPCVQVIGPDGAEHSVPSGACLVFGRSRHADLVVLGDPGLSRLAGQITVSTDGARINNLSRKHGLIAVVDGQVSQLPPSGARDHGVLLVTTGRARVGSPHMHGGGSMIEVHVDSGAVAGPPRLPDVAEETETATRMRLGPHTKEFVTALMLCRDWLGDPTRSRALPTSVSVAREALAATHTWDQLNRFDAGQADVRARITRRVEEHLRHLKWKLVDSGALEQGTRVTRERLAHHLIALRVLTPAHLRLLEDEEWLAAQAELWWDA
ncbi:hypothetical protein GCM10007079_40410 [Nocardiopsis terrae]|uniref:FHA domain-containing protein n=1 Tax=Nocardiopsis terrae TaxID=372655 RepID=A0ABR9HEK9_9ACTN|nr:FHA domain-containing protein [Nocardiopsis terrae]MBE1457427.1 hypothetical protein [Nocardiopsis terrae]GHC92132.1 hypothetical protein GCM10007079_40410 [Nocardiopsis terrae]